MDKKTGFLIVIVCSYLFAACSRCNNETYNLSAQQRAFMAFKSGSYWIMRDSLSGRRDSFVVQVNATGYSPVYGSKDCVDERESMAATIAEYNLTTRKKDHLGWLIAADISSLQTVSVTSDSTSSSVLVPFTLNFNQGSMLINSLTYSNVTTGEFINGGNRLKVYLDQDHVLLKMALLLDGTYKAVWELERANIIR